MQNAGPTFRMASAKRSHGRRRVGAGHRTADELDERAELGGLLHLRHRHQNGRVHGVRHDHVLHALPLALTQQHQPFVGGDMAGRQHEAMFGDDLNDRLRRRQQLAVSRDADERPVLFRIADLVLGIEGRHPDQAAIRPGHLGHVLDRAGFMPPTDEIQIDAAEDLDARHLLAHHVGQPGGRVVVILQDDAAHAVRARHDGRPRGHRPSARRCRAQCEHECRSRP